MGIAPEAEKAHTAEPPRVVGAAPSRAERWVVDSGVAQWVEHDQLAPLDALEDRVASLRAEVADLEKTLADARASAREDVVAEQAELVEAYRQQWAALQTRAGNAAVRVAEALVGQHLGRDDSGLAKMLARALGGHTDVQRVRVAVGMGAAAEAYCALHALAASVVEDATLALGDVILELPHGQADCRVNTLLSLVSADVHAEVADGG